MKRIGNSRRTASGAGRLYAEQDFVRSAALGCIKVPSGASKSEIPVEAHVVGAPSRQGIHIIRRQRLLPSTGRNPLCGSADRYFFLSTSTNTMRMWRTNALTPVSRNNTIGFICQVSVSSRTMALRFYQHPLAGGSPGRSRLRRRPRTWGPTERAREGGQGRQARCRGGSEDPSLPILPGRRCPHACQPAYDNRFRLRDDPLHQFLTGRDVVDQPRHHPGRPDSALGVPVRLEFPIFSLNPGLRPRGVAPDVGPTLSRA